MKSSHRTRGILAAVWLAASLLSSCDPGGTGPGDATPPPSGGLPADGSASVDFYVWFDASSGSLAVTPAAVPPSSAARGARAVGAEVWKAAVKAQLQMYMSGEDTRIFETTMEGRLSVSEALKEGPWGLSVTYQGHRLDGLTVTVKKGVKAVPDEPLPGVVTVKEPADNPDLRALLALVGRTSGSLNYSYDTNPRVIAAMSPAPADVFISVRRTGDLVTATGYSKDWEGTIAKTPFTTTLNLRTETARKQGWVRKTVNGQEQDVLETTDYSGLTAVRDLDYYWFRLRFFRELTDGFVRAGKNTSFTVFAGTELSAACQVSSVTLQKDYSLPIQTQVTNENNYGYDLSPWIQPGQTVTCTWVTIQGRIGGSSETHWFCFDGNGRLVYWSGRTDHYFYNLR